MLNKISKWLQNRARPEEKDRDLSSPARLSSIPLAGQEAQSDTPVWEEVLKEWYEVLAVPAGSDLKTVRHAWKQQLARHHRDLISEDVETKRRATLATNRINAAYRGLQDALS